MSNPKRPPAEDELMAKSRALLTEMDETLRKLKETMAQIDHHTASVSAEYERREQCNARERAEDQELDGSESDEGDDPRGSRN
jgi:septal ring factor EnvC (AmiA/AmiB activator)